MLISHKWIGDLAGVRPSAEELGERLTFGGLEVEDIRPFAAGLDKVVVGEVREKAPHPRRDNLSVVQVDSGSALLQVVCGAPNCPGPGGRVALATVGARVGELTVEPRELAGVASAGMLCSELELGLGVDHSGLLLLDGEELKVGDLLARALDLEDTIIEVSVTPNRPDALSHRGVARDVAVLYNTPFAPKPRAPASQGLRAARELATVELLDAVRCPRYGAAVLEQVSARPSPLRLRARLHALGVRPISNLVDMTNWILLEYGQPLHAFDLDLLAGAKIAVRLALEGERMTTLDGIERVFSADDLLICDAERPIAVAGIMGGEATGVTAQTRRVLIECAYFEPKGIRRTARRLKLSSESSYRFERGVDPNLGPEVLEAAAAMTAELCGGVLAAGFIDCYPHPITPQQIPLRPSRFRAVMGYDVALPEMRRVLCGLGARVEGNAEPLQVTAPTSRPDLTREIDLIEEVARICGLHEMPATLPRICCQVPDRQVFESARRAKELLASLGLDEAINYSFVPEELLAALGAAANAVRVANPLSSERAVMRTTLLAGLLESLKRAHSRFLQGIRQFEVGSTFHDQGGELPQETLRAAFLLSGPAAEGLGKEQRPFDFYDAKGAALAFVRAYTGREAALQPTANAPHLHPKRAANVAVDGQVLGQVGELHPTLLAVLKLPRGAVAFEIELAPLWAARVLPKVPALPEYPAMSRDVALLVSEAVDAGPILEALLAACGPLAESGRVFDVYRGAGIPEGKKSLAFNVTYRAPDKTLTDEEVEELHRGAVAKVTAAFAALAR